MKTYKETAIELVETFYLELIDGVFDEEDDFKEPQLTQARNIALLHLEMTDSPNLEMIGFIADDENWKV